LMLPRPLTVGPSSTERHSVEFAHRDAVPFADVLGLLSGSSFLSSKELSSGDTDYPLGALSVSESLPIAATMASGVAGAMSKWAPGLT